MPLNRIIADSITDGTIVAADIGDNTITLAKLQSGLLPPAISNSAATYANAAFTTANTSAASGSYANSAFATANTSAASGSYANSAFTTANAAVTLTGTQTLTNKTLTSPAISSPTISGTPTGVGVLTSATAVTLSSQTSVDFTGIPSWAKRVVILFSKVRQNTGGANPYVMRLGTSGGIIATGYVGAQGYVGGSPAATAMNTGFELYHDTAVNYLGGMLTVTNISGNTWVGSGEFGQTQGYTYQIGGSIALASALTQLRITTINGTNTFTDGFFNILYE